MFVCFNSQGNVFSIFFFFIDGIFLPHHTVHNEDVPDQPNHTDQRVERRDADCDDQVSAVPAVRGAGAVAVSHRILQHRVVETSEIMKISGM